MVCKSYTTNTTKSRGNIHQGESCTCSVDGNHAFALNHVYIVEPNATANELERNEGVSQRPHDREAFWMTNKKEVENAMENGNEELG